MLINSVVNHTDGDDDEHDHVNTLYCLYYPTQMYKPVVQYIFLSVEREDIAHLAVVMTQTLTSELLMSVSGIISCSSAAFFAALRINEEPQYSQLQTRVQ